MGNRGQKRAETVEDLPPPADKRACNLQESRPSTSNTSVQANGHSSSSGAEINDHDMDTSSSASGSSQSEMDLEKDSAYGSCESDEAEHRHSELREYQRQRSLGDHGKFKNILSSLNEKEDDSEKLILLTELCEVLSFCNEHSLSSITSDALSPHLVMLARHESSPDIMLLAIRAMTYLCDLYPRSAAFLVRHDAIPVLCQRLMAIEDMDVAEQCLQALEKISREQPLACLQGGAIMAVLSFLDFFSTIIQRVALSTVMNICRKLPHECSSSIMQAIPTLCNLLQYEDKQLVEIVAISLTRITERASKSSETLNELCKHGIIQQIFQLFNSNGGTTLSLPVYKGLLRVLTRLSSGSIIAFKTLHELNISSLLKDILSTSDQSHGVSSPHTVEGQCNLVYEVLKLLDELLPTSIRDQDAPELLEKESFLVSRSELLQKLGMDILPSLIQVVNSGGNLYICYGSVSVIKKLVHLSTSDMLVELLKAANISSFLAGVFTRKDPHVLLLALQTAELVLQKHSDVFLHSFIKEGVFFSVEALLAPEKCSLLTSETSSQSVVPAFSSLQLSYDSSQRSTSSGVPRCLCHAFASGNSVPASERNSCNLEKDSVYNLATHIRNSYFSSELFNSDKNLTDLLQELRTFSAALNDMMNSDAIDQNEDQFYSILLQVVTKLNGNEPISTFEFIESGIVKSLVDYLSGGWYLRRQRDCCADQRKIDAMEKRFETFARLFLVSSDPLSEDMPILTLIQKLQNGLSSLETFPVILSNTYKMRESFADVPSGHYTKYPCLKVRFVRGEGETGLRDIPKNYLTVDPLSSMQDIEGFLWPRVKTDGQKHIRKTQVQDLSQEDKQLLSTASSCPNGIPSDVMMTDLPELLETLANSSEDASKQEVYSSQTDPLAMLQRYVEGEFQFSSEADNNMENGTPTSRSGEDTSPKLLFFLEGQQLDRDMTLYQAILQKQMKGNETVTITNAWIQGHTLTYRRIVKQPDNFKECSRLVQKSALSDKVGRYLWQTTYFSSTVASAVASDLENSSPTDDILYLLRCLEKINSFVFHLISQEGIGSFAEGKLDNLDILKIPLPSVAQFEFVNSKLTEKLEQQMRDSMALSVGGMPAWCNQLMASFPFLFSFEARCKYLRLAAFGPLHVQPHQLSHIDSGAASDRRHSTGGLPRKKYIISRNNILESATKVMKLHAHHKAPLEVGYKEEVGTGLGPTLEFYTLVSHELQKTGHGMWRDDHESFNMEFVMCPLGLFPRPWSSFADEFNGFQLSKVSQKFVLLGQIVAKALQDGRVLDLHLSKAFYKLMLGQELGLFDVLSFDPQLGRTLIEFRALSSRKLFLESSRGEFSFFEYESCFRNTRIEDLCLDFSLPGYPEILLASGPDNEMVTMRNLEDYISLVVDATVKSGISRQVEAFKSGFNQVFPIEKLQIFTEEELERLLCGENESWAVDELVDHVKFDHGYTASSPPIINLLEIIQEFDKNERRAFLQFVTGAPRLPLGGFASLNPKLTVVRKLCTAGGVDADLPSVMTCANYLKLPPYSTKETMKEKLMYAITEGQGSFHLS